MTEPAPMTTHALKTLPSYFEAVLRGDKRFEVRKDDRKPPFAVGDVLRLREFDPERVSKDADGEDDLSEAYTGREVSVDVTYVFRGAEAERFGVQPGYAILSIALAQRPSVQDWLDAPDDELPSHGVMGMTCFMIDPGENVEVDTTMNQDLQIDEVILPSNAILFLERVAVDDEVLWEATASQPAIPTIVLSDDVLGFWRSVGLTTRVLKKGAVLSLSFLSGAAEAQTVALGARFHRVSPDDAQPGLSLEAEERHS